MPGLRINISLQSETEVSFVEDITVSRGKDNILDSSRNVPTSISGRPAGRNFLIARQESRPII